MINGAVYNPATTRTATCTDGSTKNGPRSVPEQLYRGAQHLGSGSAEGSRLHAYAIRATANALNNNYQICSRTTISVPTSIKIDHISARSGTFRATTLRSIRTRTMQTMALTP